MRHSTRRLLGEILATAAVDVAYRPRVVYYETRPRPRPRPVVVIREERQTEQTVAVYSTMGTYGRPIWTGTISAPTTVAGMRLCPNRGGVVVKYVGTFGPDKKFVRSGADSYIFDTRMCVAVL